MAANVFQLNNSAASVNQGAYGIPLHMKRIRGILKAPVNYYLTPTQVASSATLKTKLLADALQTNPASRIQVMGTIEDWKDNSTAAKKNTFGSGLEKTTYDGQYNLTFTFGDSDLAKQQKRQNFNGRSEDFLDFLIDEDNNLIGTKGDDGSGNTVMTGFTEADWHAMNVPFDISEGVKLSVDVAFMDSNEFNKGNLMVIPAGFNIVKTVKSLADVTIQAVSALATRVVSIAPMIENIIGTNLAAKYPTELANPSMWVVTDHATGGALTVSSATKAVVNGVDVITLTMSATSYPTSGGSIDITLTTPTLLAGSGIKYYEADILNMAV